MSKKACAWAISLLVISIVTLVIAFSNIFGVELPDVLKRVLGVIDLIALPVLAYSSVKLYTSNK